MYGIINIYAVIIEAMTLSLYTENQDLSSPKEVFFINSGKKIVRVAGIIIAALLGALFLLMVISAAAFGSAGTVGVFGFNLFICDSSDYESVPAGSAVISTSCAPYDLEEGNLVLYTTDPEDKNAPLAMGYYTDFKMTDGIYYLQLENNGDSTVISEDALIGKAGWCSPFLGAFIRFTRSPWGVLVMAVIPCALLILFDILRVKTYEKPIPEVIPQVKNQDDRPTPQITVGESGSASYSRNPSGRPAVSADSVLFTFPAAKQHSEPRNVPSAPTMSDADVLSLLNAPSGKSAAKPVQSTPEPSRQASPLFTLPADRAAAPEKPTLPAPVAAKRYIDNTTALSVKPSAPGNAGRSSLAEPVKSAGPTELTSSTGAVSAAAPAAASRVSEKTAEIPSVTKLQKNQRPDAFFAQSDAPQIGRGLAGRQNKSASRSIIDLEDALAAAPSRTARPESRRSADILAAKNRSDLITEDDDSRDKSRYEVDDILAGIEKRHKQ